MNVFDTASDTVQLPELTVATLANCMKLGLNSSVRESFEIVQTR